MPTIEPHILKLMDPMGFNDRVNELLSIYDTREKAYESAERQYEIYFGKRRFKDYNSFRHYIAKLMKSNKKA